MENLEPPTDPQVEPTDAPATALALLAIGFRQTADDLEFCGHTADAAIWRAAGERVDAMAAMMSDASPLGRLRACQRRAFAVLERVLGDLLLFRGGDCDAAAARRLWMGLDAEARDLKVTVEEWESLKR